MKREFYICDGLPGTPCGTVLVNEEDGFVLTGRLLTPLAGPEQKILVGPSPTETTETALCRTCLLTAIGSPVPPKAG